MGVLILFKSWQCSKYEIFKLKKYRHTVLVFEQTSLSVLKRIPKKSIPQILRLRGTKSE